MGRATIDAEIARLEALGRTRALTARESRMLANLVATERKYDRTAARDRRAGADGRCA